MQNVLKYRRKFTRDDGRVQKWELLRDDRKEKVSKLEEELDQLAISGDADFEMIRDIERLLEQSRAAYEESDDKLRALRESLTAVSNNADFAANELEIAVRTLLADEGLFNDQASDSDVSEPEKTRSTKRARTDTGSMEKLPSPDPQVEKKHDAIVTLREKRALVQSLEADFSNRSELYQDSRQRWQALLAAGEVNMTRTELDLQWCRNYGNLGLDLWEAEIARSRAAVDVMRLNALPISYSQTSKFADDPEDAVGLETEALRALAVLDKGKIEEWLRGVEGHGPIDQPVDLEPDNWDAPSLQFGESCSGIADGWIKIRLQRWDIIREKLWNDTKGGVDGNYALPGSGNFVIEVDLGTEKGWRRVSELQG